jgi:PIN domain nuclease of toxin-antitoxin system
MSAVVADTHAFIWYLFEPSLLSVRAKAALSQAESDPGLIYVPSICLVEVRYLVEKGTLGEDIFTQIVNSLLNSTTAPTVAPLDVDIAQNLARISRIEIPDMPDRIIAATALFLDLPLITRDRRIQSSTVPSIW